MNQNDSPCKLVWISFSRYTKFFIPAHSCYWLWCCSRLHTKVMWGFGLAVVGTRVLNGWWSWELVDTYFFSDRIKMRLFRLWKSFKMHMMYWTQVLNPHKKLYIYEIIIHYVLFSTIQVAHLDLLCFGLPIKINCVLRNNQRDGEKKEIYHKSYSYANLGLLGTYKLRFKNESSCSLNNMKHSMVDYTCI